MNRQLLYDIADHIENVPESWDLSLWADKASSRSTSPVCDTVGCVAGWAVMLVNPIARGHVAAGHHRWVDQFAWSAEATKALDLPVHEADVLFGSNTWWGTQMRAFGFEPKDGYDDFEDNYIALGAVPPKAAAHILRALADGEITLEGDWSDDF